jgi:hypothetical protein
MTHVLTALMEYDVLDSRAHVSTRRKLRALPGIATTFAPLLVDHDA